MQFSIYHKPITNLYPKFNITLQQFINLLKSDEYKYICEEAKKLKEKGQEDKLRELKKDSFDYITIAGTFKKREKKSLKELSGYYAADIDDIKNIDEIKKELKEDKYTHLLFLSPSGGIKVIIKIPKSIDNFEKYVTSYYEYLKQSYKIDGKLDKKCKEPSRACFVSYDPNYFYNEKSELWDKIIEVKELYEEEKTFPIYSETTLKAMLKHIPARNWGQHTFECVLALIHYSEYRNKDYFGVFRWWSKMFDGSISVEDMQRKWDELKRKDVDRPITIRSLVKEAMEHGYKFPEKGDKEEEVSISTSLYKTDEFMAEQIYKEGISEFCIYNYKTKEIKYEKSIETKEGTIIPIIDEMVTKEVIALPTGPIEYESDKKLDDEIKKHIKKWLDIPEDVLQFAVWNIKRSWVYERFHTLNYLRALGDAGTGKTRFLDTLGYLHYKPIATSGATTAAPIFRIIERWGGTLIMDEADFAKSDEAQDIIKIINLGYENGKYILRCEQNNSDNIRCFDPYCPKILATRKTFTDKATESRCITQVMKGTMRKDIPLNLNKSFFDDVLLLRNKLLMWRFKNYDKINPDIETDFDLGELEPRVKQIVTSFISLFSNDKKQMEVFKIFITKHQEDIIDERRNSFAGEVVGAIHSLLDDKIIDISAQDIIIEGKITDFKGNTSKPRSLSSTLKSLGFEKSISKKIDGKAKRCIPLDKEHLKNIFERYGYEVTVVTMVKGIETIKTTIKEYIKKVDEKKVRDNRKYRNDRNFVTEFLDKNIGLSTDEIAKELKITVGELFKILQDMKKDGDIIEPEHDKWVLI